MTRRTRVLDAAELVTPDVRAAIEALGLGREHDGMVKLALIYAATIDRGGVHCSGCDDPECSRPDRSWGVRWIGPSLHAALEALGASPAGAAAIAKARGGEKKPDAPPSRLDQLRKTSTASRRA